MRHAGYTASKLELVILCIALGECEKPYGLVIKSLPICGPGRPQVTAFWLHFLSRICLWLSLVHIIHAGTHWVRPRALLFNPFVPLRGCVHCSPFSLPDRGPPFACAYKSLTPQGYLVHQLPIFSLDAFLAFPLPSPSHLDSSFHIAARCLPSLFCAPLAWLSSQLQHSFLLLNIKSPTHIKALISSTSGTSSPAMTRLMAMCM